MKKTGHIDTGKIGIAFVAMPLLQISAYTKYTKNSYVNGFRCVGNLLHISSMTIRTLRSKLVAFVLTF